MKIFNNTLENQYFTPENYELVFGVEPNVDLSKSPIICRHEQSFGDFTVQVAFNDVPAYENNTYLVLLYKNDELIDRLYAPSHKPVPPVWDRVFSIGIDYFDWVMIQKRIKPILNKFGYELEIDYSTENKGFCFTTQPIEECLRLIENGESYQIMELFPDREGNKEMVDKIVEAAKTFNPE